MEQCDYCGAEFESEDAYLAHLAGEHEGELSAIDRRRAASVSDDDGEFPTGPVIIVLVVAFSLALVVYVTMFVGGGNGSGASLPSSGDQSVVSEVQTESSQGRQHVQPGTDIEYATIPPTSGTHYDGRWANGGFYESEQPLGELVHSLEHGAVIVYYDPAALSGDAEESMREFGQTYTSDFMSFIAVPNPSDDPEAAYVVTAWQKRLAMDEYDEETVRQFMAEYIGRGPERQVR